LKDHKKHVLFHRFILGIHEQQQQQQEEKEESFQLEQEEENIIDFNFDKLFPFHKEIPQHQRKELYNYVQSIRNPYYESHPNVLQNISYDIYNCPDYPPKHYPLEYSIMDILHNWNPNDTVFSNNNIHHYDGRPKIYSTICRFNFQNKDHLYKAFNYRQAEVPFILRDDPSILQVVQNWNKPGYLSKILNDNGPKYKTEYSTSNHLMFYRESSKRKSPTDWEPPISTVKLTYDEWVEKASQSIDEMGPTKPHWYFRVNAKSTKEEGNFLFNELPFFQSKENFYIVDENDTRGINCRFGMNGNIAEAHFDGSRNFVMLFGGERRYILSHPKHCKNLALYSADHPSGRHSRLDWSNPDIDNYPEFKDAQANEVVLQAGDVLYLPTHWFHFIISLNLNWQCNARSGITNDYQHHIKACGFRG